MDVFFESGKNIPVNKLWKNPGGKKIIWAPHHSVREVPHTATFEQNYRFFLEYARAHSKETSWVVKPHPLLAISAVKAGIFQSAEEWNKYLREWEILPNAVVINGQYGDIFKTSDCMILDSVSFKAEYLYVHKPLLYLTSDMITNNEFGDLVQERLYTAPGNDFAAITEFIENISETDPNKYTREQFFRDELDYYSRNKMLARDRVYLEIGSLPKGGQWWRFRTKACSVLKYIL